MRRGMWVLAVWGAAVVSADACVAADPVAPKLGRIPATGVDVPTRYTRDGRDAAAVDVPKNFKSELFAEKVEAAAKNTAASTAGATSGRALSGVRVEPRAERTAAYESTRDADAPTQHAAWKKPVDATENHFIQPVRHTEERVSAAPKPAVASENAPQVPSVSVEWVRRSEINVGQECAVDLVVRNTGSVAAKNVAVDAFFPTTVRLTDAQPRPTTISEHLTWDIAALAPGSEQKISIKMIPSRRGELGTNAVVRLTGSASAMFRVEEPMIKVAVKGPSDIMVGDAASQTVVVSNPGSGVVSDVRVEATLTDGLESAKGQKFVIELGSINPGESQTVRLPLTAVSGGAQTLTVLATSSSDVSHMATTNINVLAPAIKLTLDGPGLRYKGRAARYVATVKNDGAVPTNNIRVVQQVADGFKFVSADRGGKYDSARRAVVWFVGRLEPGQTMPLSCELTADAIGSFQLMAQATSDANNQVEAKIHTVVEGSSALTMKVIDLDDPVEVGNETAYEIRVANEGTKAANDVTITCELPPGLELIRAKGATEGISDGKVVGFKPLASLAPGTEALFRVHVRGTEEGNLRFRARVTSNSIDQPLLIEEQTKFYSDVR